MSSVPTWCTHPFTTNIIERRSSGQDSLTIYSETIEAQLIMNIRDMHRNRVYNTRDRCDSYTMWTVHLKLHTCTCIVCFSSYVEPFFIIIYKHLTNICLFVCLFICVFVYFVCLFICVFVYLCVCLCVFFYLKNYFCLYLPFIKKIFVYVFVYLSMRLFISLSVCLSVYVFVYLSICLCLCVLVC